MFVVLPDSIGGDIDKELSDNLRYPSQQRYRKEHDLLPPLAVKLKLKNMPEFEKVQRHLGQLKRIGIDTKVDYNCAIHAVTLQVKLLKHCTNDTVRHQLAEHMVEDYIYYYPMMRQYLDKNKLSYSSYIMNLYSGHIWADEFMLGALGRMLNLKITVLSPAYCNGHRILPFVKDRSLYPTHDPPLYSEQQHCMLQFNKLIFSLYLAHN